MRRWQKLPRSRPSLEARFFGGATFGIVNTEALNEQAGVLFLPGHTGVLLPSEVMPVLGLLGLRFMGIVITEAFHEQAGEQPLSGHLGVLKSPSEAMQSWACWPCASWTLAILRPSTGRPWNCSILDTLAYSNRPRR